MAAGVMRVGIDGNCLRHPLGGVARYVEGLLKFLPAVRGRDALRISVLAPDSVHATMPWVLWHMQRASGGAFDALHFPFYYPCLFPRCPITVAIHDVLVIEHPEWFPRAWAAATAALLRHGSRRAAAIVTGSAAVAAAIESLCGVPRERVAVIPYGVDPATFGPPSAAGEAAARARFGLERPFLLQTGAFEPRRGLELSIEAARAAREVVGDLELVLAGDARGEVQGLKRAPAFVRRLGRVGDRDLAALFPAAAAVLAPSYGEGFDLPVLEALACGAAVIASDIPVHVEHFAGAVELFAGGDADALAQACLRVLTDGARRAALRAAGPRLAAGYTWQECAERHAALWSQVRGS